MSDSFVSTQDWLFHKGCQAYRTDSHLAAVLAVLHVSEISVVKLSVKQSDK